MRTFVLKVLPVAVMMGLVGCQTLTPAVKAQSPVAVEIAQTQAEPTNVHAKQAVQDGIKALLKSSFSYQTQVYLEPKAIAQDDDLPETACEEIHDTAYIDLVKKAQKAGLDITADDYINERTALKDDFLACVEARSDGSEA